METWKSIVGYERLYSISTEGRIKSHFHNAFLRPADNGKGYKFVWLNKNGRRERFYVHRLVALVFIPNPQNKPQINHKDCNRSNNYVENLEWVDNYEQMQHASRNGKLHSSDFQKQQTSIANSGTKSHLSKLTDINVREIRDIKKKTGLSNIKIADMFGVNRETIGYIIRCKTWKHLL